ncbi:nitric oxide synthase oxygenase [Cohnella thailandensis]|uniref:Nitric oxide synthase oxygenase n=1 Tax=Cohnella thailandensis TaxID=557557 RepID=A0A841SU33_9BACL|nr:nitric oxide synthase oxygenase [Cohnella thailandensis]MBB6633728.1 nitric oxide synthase oxygenase [Cohnella thailandensis]MBP1976516.1 nitric-oxide synthase [Cohnella thailandensis]
MQHAERKCPFSEALYKEAEAFVRTSRGELGMPAADVEKRLGQLEESLRREGNYSHTFEELEHGAKMAWRNANRCIGRLFWNRMRVFDERGCETERQAFEALLRHIEFATNGGEIRPAITIFKPANPDGSEPIRIWNHQLIRYAGYETENGIVGDPASVTFTKVCLELGWRGEGTPFDVLPLVIQANGQKPRWFRIPDELVLEVPLSHPTEDLFGSFSAKWYAVPIISDMALTIGGIRYPAAPFNGWYMETEIGARNLADEFRYDLIPLVAEQLGLDTSSHSTLWKDRALLELNVAVLHSFRQAGVSIVDHHTAAQQFKMFQRNEEKEGREVTGRWSWLIPPLSPALTHIFHSTFEDKTVLPGFLSQKRPYEADELR